jgi:hypothetical protein
MKLTLTVLSLFLTLTLSAQKQKKAVFIIVDGIPGDVIEKLQPPALMEISKAGGFTLAYTGGLKSTYNETPTISAPGYNNLITGVWGNKHNVWDNDINDPNYNYLNIFQIAEQVKPSLKTAIFSTWTDNRTKLVGEDVLDYSFDGLELDTITYPHDKDANHIKNIDAAVSAQAAKYIQENGPDLSWVYLEYTDDMGHRYGDSDQFYNAITNADQQIKGIWDAITLRESSFNEEWLIIITTDHGRDAQTGKNHGGQSDRERLTWIVTNSKDLNGHFKNRPAVVDILPSITNFMGIRIPEETRNELDGVPFIGPLEFSDLHASKQGDKILVEWKSMVKDDRKLEIFITPTNNFKKGDKDQYVKIAEVPVKAQKFQAAFKTTSTLLKIVIKTPDQALNTWIGK